jgi:hypothetical protein
MQPLKYLTADHPYLVIRDNNDGTCNIKLCRNKPKQYDPKSLLKKIHSIVENNLTYITESKDVCRSGHELWQKLEVIANEMVKLHGNEKLCFKAKYKKSLKKQYNRILSIIKIKTMTKEQKRYLEELELIRLVRRYRYKPPSMGHSYLFML